MLPAIQSPIIDLIQFLNRDRKKKVVVVGYGWGGASFANNIDNTKYNVTIVSKTKSRFNQPYIIAHLEPSFTDPPSATEIIEDEALLVDDTKQILQCSKNNYSYDYLIISTGSEPNDFGVKGVKEHCLMFKTGSDLNILNDKLKTNSHITIIGAGPTGIELAFKISSLGKTVTILEASNQILPGFSDSMRKLVMDRLAENKITVKTATQIKAVFATGYLSQNANVDDNSIKIWTCGIKPVEFARKFMPRINPNVYLEIKPRIYAIGDSIIGYGPPTAQNAKAQGKYLAERFNSDFKIDAPYTYVEKGRVIDAASCLIVEYNGYVLTLPSLFRIVYQTLTQ